MIQNGLVIVVSQSGETADSLAALRDCKGKGNQDAWYCKCGWFFYCKRSRQCILYTCRTGDFCCDNKGLQHTADRSLCTGNSVCKGKRSRLTKSSMQDILKSCRHFRRRSRKSLRIRSAFSGLRPSRQMQRIFSL